MSASILLGRCEKCSGRIWPLHWRNLYQWFLLLHCGVWTRIFRQHHLGGARHLLGAYQIYRHCHSETNSLYDHRILSKRIAPILCGLFAWNVPASSCSVGLSEQRRGRSTNPKKFEKVKRYKMKQNHVLHIAIIVLICTLCLASVTGCGSRNDVCYRCGSCATSSCFNSCNSLIKGCGTCIDCTGCGSFCDGCGAFLRD